MDLNVVYDFAKVEVGEHLYWTLGGYQVHGQVIICSSIVLLTILTLNFFTTTNLEIIPGKGQNFMEYIVEFVRDIAKTQIGEEEYLTWAPYIGTLFLFIFVSNWEGALVPWKLIHLPEGFLTRCPFTTFRIQFPFSHSLTLRKFFKLHKTNIC